jgi:hypothetical protein
MIGGMRRVSGHWTRRLQETWTEPGDEWERSETKSKQGLMTDRD